MKPEVLFAPGPTGHPGQQAGGRPACPAAGRRQLPHRPVGRLHPDDELFLFQHRPPPRHEIWSALGGSSLMLGPRSSLDIGARQPIHIGKYPASIRLRIENVLDTAAWYVLASNTYSPADRRRFSLSLLVDIQ